MLKSYLRPEQAAEYLTNKTGDAYSLSDIKDLAIEDCIDVLVYFNGGVTEFIFVESTFDDASGEEKNLDIYSFEGYFNSRELIKFLNYSGMQKMPYPIGVYEILNASSSLRLERFIGVFPTSSKYPTTFRNTDNWPAMFNADTDLYICRKQLDALVSKSNIIPSEIVTPTTAASESITTQNDTASLAMIGALLAMLRKHHSRKTQDNWIDEILEMKDAEFPNARGLSESQMKKIFSAANKAFKNLKEQ